MKFVTAILCFLLLTACNKDSTTTVLVDNNKTPHPESPITPPANFRPLNTELTEIILGWEDEANAYAYELLRDGLFLAKISAGLFTYTDSTVLPKKHYRYTLVALNSDGKRSLPVELTITTQDNTPPELQKINDTMTLSSDQPVNQRIYQINASDADNHALHFSLRGDTHALFNISTSGELSLATPLLDFAGKTIKLAIDVSDGLSVRTATLDIGVIPIASSMVKKGIVRQVYEDDSISSALDTLKDFIHFPHKPTLTTFEEAFQSPSNHDGHYGQQLHGFLIPPTSGEYTFWIASDDQSELSLSSSAAMSDER